MSRCRAVRAIVTAAMMFVAATAFAPEDTRAHTGFLGVMLEIMFQPIGPLETSPDNDATGVLIQDGVPGYCGYRFLRVGDVVMGVVSNEQIIRTSLDVELRQTVQAI